MIKGLCNGGLLDDASELLEKMDGNGCSPNDRTYNTIIRGLLQHNETSKAMKYLHIMVEKGLLANKQDLPNAMNAAEIIEKLRLHSRHQRHRLRRLVNLQKLFWAEARDELHSMLNEVNKGSILISAKKKTNVEAPRPNSGTRFESPTGSANSASPLLRAALSSLRGLTRRSSRSSDLVGHRAFFCSDSDSSGDVVVHVEAKAVDSEAEEVETKSSSAIVSTNPRPEDYLTDPKLLAALQESRKRQAPYAGAFLVKDEPGTDPSLVSGSESEKNIYDLKGKDLLNRLHEVGTLAQISSIQGDQVVLIGHRRLQITEMVSEDPLTVKVDHLKDKPYNKDTYQKTI
uniref:Lon N-terminal domain-containing protein n=1 Tax=Fagus sylvatica TaxID=28930 RepID=A0A2N9J9P4_FAGSY